MTKAFTLIELLIVVAIIAILAAIAVPNFLEAQTRAKVTRTMADMRSVSVAIESYVVDNNELPTIVTQDYWVNYLMINNGNARYPGQLLTTPIGYMSAIPIDPFNSSLLPGASFRVPGKDISYIATFENLGREATPITAWMHEMRMIGGFHGRVKWAMESAGPDLVWWGDPPLARHPNRFLYDPTNGTLSQGQLVLTNQGWISPRK